MTIERQEKRKPALTPRRKPIQQRALERTRQILDTTARLLDEVGIDDLTTILIAKELGISVGSLYHYFPNKHAILFSLGEQWLEGMTTAMNDMDAFDIDNMSLQQFIGVATDRMLMVYTTQRAMLPLAQALWSIPELRDLDLEHDNLVISRFVTLYKRLGLKASEAELQRLGQLYLEATHSLLLIVVAQKGARAKRSLGDLKAMLLALLKPHET